MKLGRLNHIGVATPSIADSIVFSIPVGEAEGRVAAYLLLTMAPLALAGPLPLGDGLDPPGESLALCLRLCLYPSLRRGLSAGGKGR